MSGAQINKRLAKLETRAGVGKCPPLEVAHHCMSYDEARAVYQRNLQNMAKYPTPPVPNISMTLEQATAMSRYMK